MKITKKVLCFASLVVGAFCLSACASTQSFSATAPSEYSGPKTVSGKSLNAQLQEGSPSANQNIVFMVGQCEDKTGKYLDGDQLRYSRAVTQACPEIIAHYVRMAGFKLAERTPYNMQLLTQEYSLSHMFQLASPDNPGTPKNIGLIQRGGPSGGLTGANYMWTGAIVQYNSNTKTGGGGVSVDAIGGTVQRSVAQVGIELRLVDMSTGLVVSSSYLHTTITGHSVDFHLTRLIGDVATSLAANLTGGTSSTVLQSTGTAHIISGEFGGAMQAPIDYAVTDVIVASLSRQLEANQAVFYVKPVQFRYDVPTE